MTTTKHLLYLHLNAVADELREFREAVSVGNNQRIDEQRNKLNILHEKTPTVEQQQGLFDIDFISDSTL